MTEPTPRLAVSPSDIDQLLTVAFRHVISEPNIEAGYERFSALAHRSIEFAPFCDAVATCLYQGLIHEPVRLPEGALQCHWHLELTPAGVAAARIARNKDQGYCRPDVSNP
jgi:hypothetical protein